MTDYVERVDKRDEVIVGHVPKTGEEFLNAYDPGPKPEPIRPTRVIVERDIHGNVIAPEFPDR